MKSQTLRYQSSVDGTNPLIVDVCFEPSRTKLPLIVVMHGYSSGNAPVLPDMRGRGKSAGTFDSSGLDVMDIYDAVQVCCQRFPRQIDASNLNIMGYSGGGGNTFACVVRFPDTFRVAASYFGVPDYAAFHRSKGRVDCNLIMEEAVGGTPKQLPDAYAARNATLAAGNNGQTRFHIFWDEAETACPGWMDDEFISASRAAGNRNCIPHLSRKRDRIRWHHGYTTDWPELIQSEQMFVPEILKRRVPEPKLPRRGRVIVPGYLVTKRFQVWVQPKNKPELFGRSGVAEVEYRLGPPHDEFIVRSVTKGHEVKIISAAS